MAHKLIKSLQNFSAAWNDLQSAWSKEGIDLSESYPFEQSFDDLLPQVQHWVEQSQQTVDKEVFYLIFGEDAVREYNNEGIEGLISNKDEIATYKFVEGVNSVRELMDAMSGWLAYEYIAESEYEALQ